MPVSPMRVVLRFAQGCPYRICGLSGGRGGLYSCQSKYCWHAKLPGQRLSAQGSMKLYYTTDNYAMKNSVGYLMRICTNRVLPQMEALFQDQELTFSQWTTLVALHDGRITTPGDLAQNICHDAGSLTRLVDQMVGRG